MLNVIGEGGTEFARCDAALSIARRDIALHRVGIKDAMPRVCLGLLSCGDADANEALHLQDHQQRERATEVVVLELDEEAV